jgi:hypothetical protein
VTGDLIRRFGARVDEGRQVELDEESFGAMLDEIDPSGR